MITPRKTVKPDMRKPLDLQSHASGLTPTGILEGWRVLAMQRGRNSTTVQSASNRS
jgi:hypothetical protein